MPGSILIIDSLATNRIMLKVKLRSAFYEVVQAASLAEARALLKKERCDLILLGDGLTDADSLAACKVLKSGKHARLPLVLISASTARAHRMQALRAGADEVLCKPLEDLVLLARLRSLLRSRSVAEELRLREGTSEVLGFAEQPIAFQQAAHVLIASADPAQAVSWQSRLKPLVPYTLSQQALEDALCGMTRDPVPDVFVIALDGPAPEVGLRVLAEIRARARTRYAGILVVLGLACPTLIADALDLGANDVMSEGFDAEEMSLRLAGLVQQKRLADRLRADVRDGLQAAVTDPLTGLFNRRYAMAHLDRIAAKAQKHKRDFAVMVGDLDHFKAVNDRYGHAAGDAVLTEVAHRLRDQLRPADLVARIGGEEFLITLPETSRAEADQIAERLCAHIRAAPVSIKDQDLMIPMTISIGVAMGSDFACAPQDLTRTLLAEADQALYGAKAHGRNQVTFSVSAA